MTAICVDRKGFHKSIVVHQLEETINVPWQIKFSPYMWSLDPKAPMPHYQHSTFKLTSFVQGTGNQVGLYEEV